MTATEIATVREFIGCIRDGEWFGELGEESCKILEQLIVTKAFSFSPERHFNSPIEAVELINQQPVPVDALLAVVRANIELEEFDFASDVVQEYGVAIK